MTRHTDAMHMMRPDRVYRTGVIVPVMGYAPEQDVMAVAQAFTQGPYAFSQGNGALGSAIAYGMQRRNAAAKCTNCEDCCNPGCAGCPDPRSSARAQAAQAMSVRQLRGINPMGALQRLGYRLRAWWNGRKARQFMLAAGAQQAMQQQAVAHAAAAMPANAAGPRIAPQAYSQLNALATMAQQYQPSDWGAYNTDAILARWSNLRAATR